MAKFLGDCGAEVVHIESGTRPDNMRSTLPMKDNLPGINRSAAFARYNSSKYGVSLNLGNPKGVEIARRLTAWADVVVENFSSGTMERMGLGYDETQEGQRGHHRGEPAHVRAQRSAGKAPRPGIAAG